MSETDKIELKVRGGYPTERIQIKELITYFHFLVMGIAAKRAVC